MSNLPKKTSTISTIGQFFGAFILGKLFGVIGILVFFGLFYSCKYFLKKNNQFNSLAINLIAGAVSVLGIGAYLLLLNYYTGLQSSTLPAPVAKPITATNSVTTQANTLPTQLQTQTALQTTVANLTPNNDIALAQANTDFNLWIANLNQAWKQLTPNTRKSILAEQRSFNQQREEKCQQYALTTIGTATQQQTVNLVCQTEALKKRTQYLQTQVHTTIAPSPITTYKKTPVETAKNTEEAELIQAKKSYDKAIFNLNQAWQKLDPSVRESIRLKQRANNQQRETQCKNQSLTISNEETEQQKARFLCEVPAIQERTEYLNSLLGIPKLQNPEEPAIQILNPKG